MNSVDVIRTHHTVDSTVRDPPTSVNPRIQRSRAWGEGLGKLYFSGCKFVGPTLLICCISTSSIRFSILNLGHKPKNKKDPNLQWTMVYKTVEIGSMKV